MNAKKTNAPVPAPKSKFLGSVAVAPTEVPNNMNERPVIKDMSFKMELAWHTEFKMAAAAANISMTDLLRESFELWKEKRGMK